MAQQAKRKTTSKTTKKQTSQTRQRSAQRSEKDQKQSSNTFFLITMSFLAATLLVMNLVMLNA